MEEKDIREIVDEEQENPLPGTVNEEPEAPAADAPAKSVTVTADIFSWLDTLVYSVLVIVAVFALVTRVSFVDGTSMLPTLEDGNVLMITNLFYQPAYNDIVVVWSDFLPNDQGGRGKPIVKRVIGLPGDKISIDFDAGRVSRNGEMLEITSENGVLFEDGHRINTYTNESEGSSGEFTVPDGHLFVMGDNRNGSTDSRSYMVGYVDSHSVMGKAYLRVVPLDKFGGLYS